MRFLTDFADEAVVLPLALLVALVLLAQGWRRGALAWVVATGGTLGTVLVLKLACDWLPTAGLRSPSGHTAAAGAIYGGLAAMLLVRVSAPRAAAVALAWVAVFAATRLALGVHTLPEVLVGGAVGVLGATALRVLAGARPPGLKRERLAMAAAIVALAMHGHHVELEHDIGATARALRRSVAGASSDADGIRGGAAAAQQAG